MVDHLKKITDTKNQTVEYTYDARGNTSTFTRGNYIDAILSVGCIVFTYIADAILKPIKWTAKRIIKKILSKLSKSLLDNDVIKTVRNGCNAFQKYIYNLFHKSEVWKKDPFICGIEIEKILSKTKYIIYECVGKLAGGYFPVFDFIKGNNGISVKTLNMGVGKYVEPDEAIKQINKYVDDLINSSKKIDDLKRERKDKKW